MRRNDAHPFDPPALRALLALLAPAPGWTRLGRAYALGAAAHLTLPDASQEGWLPWNVALALGAAGLLWRPAPPFFALSLLGALGPLLFLRDHLTQSLLLLLFAALGAAAGLLPRRAPSLLRAAALSTALTYIAAGLHKLNRDFLEPATSCAIYGLDEVWTYYRVPAAIPERLIGAAPALVIATELLIGLLFLLGRRRLAWPLAAAFHIGLTLTMAPAFAFVMAIGHAALITDEDARWWRTRSGTRRALFALTALALTASSLAAHGAWIGAVAALKECALWGALVASFALLLSGSPGGERPRRFDPLASIIAALFACRMLLPYTGLEVQHSAAMLSNLRVDRGCWNSIVFPESVRRTDDYVRIDAVWFGAPGANEAYERIVLEGLWSPAQLYQMQRNWCRPASRPFYIVGSWRGRAFSIPDLCAVDPDELGFEGAGVLGSEIFPDYLRFQKNMTRACPQACIH